MFRVKWNGVFVNFIGLVQRFYEVSHEMLDNINGMCLVGSFKHKPGTRITILLGVLCGLRGCK